jgi:transposase
LFTTATLADFVPDDHPLREIHAFVDEALGRMNSLFSTLYPETGRASIAPEKLLRAQLLQMFYSIRSERLLMEQLQYNLLFRWFVGIAIDEVVWDHSVFSKNRDRLNDEVAAQFLREVVVLAQTDVGRASFGRWHAAA